MMMRRLSTEYADRVAARVLAAAPTFNIRAFISDAWLAPQSTSNHMWRRASPSPLRADGKRAFDI